VTKYLVYNARKRAEGGDTAEHYFLRTENIAGVKDMRFQATMPDVLHWLGVTQIDRMISMSNMKYDAIVGSGIKIIERVEIPGDMVFIFNYSFHQTRKLKLMPKLQVDISQPRRQRLIWALRAELGTILFTNKSELQGTSIFSKPLTFRLNSVSSGPNQSTEECEGK
jgi:hypothetical protein